MKKICFIAVLLMVCASFAFTEIKYEAGTTSYVNVQKDLLVNKTENNYERIKQNANGI